MTGWIRSAIVLLTPTAIYFVIDNCVDLFPWNNLAATICAAIALTRLWRTSP